MTRIANLIEVARKFCEAFSQNTSKEYSPAPFLGAHAKSLQTVVALAEVLKLLVEKFLSVNFDPRGRYRGRHTSPVDIDVISIKVGSLSLEALLAGQSVIKRVVTSRALRMTKRGYDVLNFTSPEDATEPTRGRDENVDEQEILACDEEGIMEV